MKLPETKLNIGDSLWSMSANKPVEWIVESIKCFATNKCLTTNKYYWITYELCKADNPRCKISIDEESIGFYYFESKQKLMKNLFGDCLTEGLVVK